jgi:single-stranded-DNA-specific exonuclease
MSGRWLISRTNPEYVRYISQTASVSPVFAQVLINRGLRSAADITSFLYPCLTGLSDPFEIPSMHTAVERIKAAFRNRERVLVHGDYDTDGLTATAIMVQALRTNGLDVSYFIPSRTLHGYGFHPPAVELAKKFGAKLIITVDCGITSFDAVQYAKRAGIEVVITDHHEPHRKAGREQRAEAKEQNTEEAADHDSRITNHGFNLPDAVAVVNPKLGPDDQKFSGLSGAGVAFKVAEAAAMTGDLPFSRDDLLPLLDLAALGTLADVVPLTGDNRIILKEGLKLIQSGARQGISALKEVSGLSGKESKAGRLSYTLIPRINAAGRVDHAGDVVELLLSDNREKSLQWSSWLDDLNRTRQQIEGEVYRQAVERLRERDPGSAIILAGEGWHEGVLGIVASRLAEEFYRPVVIFSLENGIAKGSARSIPAFDLCRALAEGSEMLLSFGGHRQAAGVKLKAEDLPLFEKTICSIVQRSLDAAELQPALEIDTGVGLHEISHDLVREFGLLEPFGCENPEPLLGSKALGLVDSRIVGERHLKTRLKGSSKCLDAIGFEMAGSLETLQKAASVDAVFTPEINEWNGGRYLQLVLKAIRPSEKKLEG